MGTVRAQRHQDVEEGRNKSVSVGAGSKSSREINNSLCSAALFFGEIRLGVWFNLVEDKKRYLVYVRRKPRKRLVLVGGQMTGVRGSNGLCGLGLVLF